MNEREFDDAADFEDVPELDFFQDACASLARNTCILLRAAGEQVTCDNVLRVIFSLPWTLDHAESDLWERSYTYQLLKRCGARNYTLWSDLHWYFVIFNIRQTTSALRMRQAAFAGILGGMDWESALGQVPEARQALVVADDRREPRGGLIGKVARFKKWLTRKRA